jgi:hypothetical protein
VAVVFVGGSTSELICEATSCVEEEFQRILLLYVVYLIFSYPEVGRSPTKLITYCLGGPVD